MNVSATAGGRAQCLAFFFIGACRWSRSGKDAHMPITCVYHMCLPHMPTTCAGYIYQIHISHTYITYLYRVHV